MFCLNGYMNGRGKTVFTMISCCFGALLVAVIVYALLVIALKAITYDDCMLLPKGDKIAKILRIR